MSIKILINKMCINQINEHKKFNEKNSTHRNKKQKKKQQN